MSRRVPSRPPGDSGPPWYSVAVGGPVCRRRLDRECRWRLALAGCGTLVLERPGLGPPACLHPPVVLNLATEILKTLGHPGCPRLLRRQRPERSRRGERGTLVSTIAVDATHKPQLGVARLRRQCGKDSCPPRRSRHVFQLDLKGRHRYHYGPWLADKGPPASASVTRTTHRGCRSRMNGLPPPHARSVVPTRPLLAPMGAAASWARSRSKISS